MQELVRLKLSLRKLHTSEMKAEVLGLTFARFTLYQRTEDVTTDRLLVSDEAVRVLDTRV
jgi:hypothetical protein